VQELDGKGGNCGKMKMNAPSTLSKEPPPFHSPEISQFQNICH
jgi:hypothetical protein